MEFNIKTKTISSKGMKVGLGKVKKVEVAFLRVRFTLEEGVIVLLEEVDYFDLGIIFDALCWNWPEEFLQAKEDIKYKTKGVDVIFYVGSLPD